MSAPAQATTAGEPPEFSQIKEALGLTFRGIDRTLAALDQVQADLGQARADCSQSRELAAGLFNGPGPRAPLVRSAYRTAVLESEDPAFLKSVLVDAWKKSDWAYDALASQSAGVALPTGGPAR